MTFEESVVIESDLAELFQLSQDYDRRLEWDPFLRSARLLGEARQAGVGVRAVCVARSGWAMETEYVSFIPPRTTAVKMTHGPWFLDRFAGAWHFDQVEPGRTRVSFRYNVQAWPKWLSWLLTPILTRVFGRDTRHRLQAMKNAVERRGPWKDRHGAEARVGKTEAHEGREKSGLVSH
jgi:ribosome-associated toxin RatA of RatAB toxin-antitoxin module